MFSYQHLQPLHWLLNSLRYIRSLSWLVFQGRSSVSGKTSRGSCWPAIEPYGSRSSLRQLAPQTSGRSATRSLGGGEIWSFSRFGSIFWWEVGWESAGERWGPCWDGDVNLSAEDQVKMSSMEQLVIVCHSHRRTHKNGNDGLSCHVFATVLWILQEFSRNYRQLLAFYSRERGADVEALELGRFLLLAVENSRRI